MRKSITLICALLSGVCAWSDFAGVRNAMDALESSIPPRHLEPESVMEIGGMYFQNTSQFRSFASEVSNDWYNVLTHIDDIATNQTERCFILGVGWQYGWEFHLPFFNKLADECLEGNVSLQELCWYEAFSGRRGIKENFYRLYYEPAVSNLIIKLISITGETNSYENILSGAESAFVDEYIQHGVFYAPE